MTYPIFGFIGTGNMGGALAKAASCSLHKEQLLLADHDTTKANTLANNIGAQIGTNQELATCADFLFLGVKPQMMKEMLRGIQETLKGRTKRIVLVSMAAGLTVSSIRDMADGNYPVIRIMPNMPVSVGAGMILAAYDGTTEEEKACFLQFMTGAGCFSELPERLIDAGSALSGCGPAFVSMFLEALADGAVACGLPRAEALRCAAQTLIGTAMLYQHTGMHPGVIKDAVCSPGGSTIQGVLRLEDGAFRSDVADAVIAAYEKTCQLGKIGEKA